jgi:hypothetical protein
MAIQKFKFGQEITSAKLNEIVSFLNSLEHNLNLLEYYNTNIQGKLDGFTASLTVLKEDVESLLSSATNFDLITNKFTTILTQYYALLQDNVEPLFQEYFSNISITEPDVNGNSYWVFDTEVTSFLAGVKGDKGDQGIQGPQGNAGEDGNVLHFGSGTPSIELGVEGDGYLDYTNFKLFYKEIVQGADVASWVQKGVTFKGDVGATGQDGLTTKIEFQYLNTLNDPTPSTTPTTSTKYIRFRTYYVDSSNVIQGEPGPWTQMQTRSSRYIPVIDEEAGTLRWVLDEGNVLPSLDPVNIIGPQGVKGDKGDSGNEFVVKGLKANTASLPTSGVEGDAWFVGTSEPYDVYIWDIGLSPAAWRDVGPLQGLQGETGPIGATGAQGPTGPRGSKIFVVPSDVEGTILGTTYNSITLIVGDIFIEQDTGKVFQIITIDSEDTPPVTFELVYEFSLLNELAYNEAKLIPLEDIAIGDVVQFVAIKNSKKLVAKATPFNGVSLTYNSESFAVPNVTENAEVIMGIAAEAATAGQNGFKINYFGYIQNFNPAYLTFTADETAILYFDSVTTEHRGRLTKTKPATDKLVLTCALFLGDNQDTLVVRMGHGINIAEVKGLQNALDAKQATITGGATTITSTNLTASRALTSDANGKVAVSSVTSTELGYLSGVTGGIQSQIALKANSASPSFTGTPYAPTATAGTNTTQIATTQFVTTGLATKANTSHSHAISDVTNLQTNLNNKTETNDLEWRFHGYTKTNITSSSFTVDQSILYKADGTTLADAFDVENFDYKFVYYAAVNMELSTSNIDETSENDNKIIKLRLNGITSNLMYAYVAQRIVMGFGTSGTTVYEDNRGESGTTNSARSSYIQTITVLDDISTTDTGVTIEPSTSGVTYNKLEFIVSESYASSSSQSSGILMVEGEGNATYGNIGGSTGTLRIGSSKAWFSGTLKNASTLTSVTFLDTIGSADSTIELQKIQVYKRKRWQ